jgi:hypothetical protein
VQPGAAEAGSEGRRDPRERNRRDLEHIASEFVLAIIVAAGGTSTPSLSRSARITTAGDGPIAFREWRR